MCESMYVQTYSGEDGRTCMLKCSVHAYKSTYMHTYSGEDRIQMVKMLAVKD